MHIRTLALLATLTTLTTATIYPCAVQVENPTRDRVLIVFSDTKEARTVSPSETQKFGSKDRLANFTIYRAAGRSGYFSRWFVMEQTSCTPDKLVKIKITDKGIDKKYLSRYFTIAQHTPKKKAPKRKAAIQVDNSNRYLSILFVAVDGSEAVAVYKNVTGSLGTKGQAAHFYVYCANDTHGDYELCFKLEQKLDSVGKEIKLQPADIATKKKSPFKVTQYDAEGTNKLLINPSISDQIITRKVREVKRLYPKPSGAAGKKKGCGCKGKKKKMARKRK